MRRLSLRRLWPPLMAAAAFLLLALRPAAAAAAAREGLETCLRSVIPSLFPFFVLTNLLMAFPLPARLLALLGEPYERLFRLPRATLGAFLMGLLGGYPVGAAAAAECCRRGICTREEAERLLICGDNCSPGFIFAVVGGAVFRDKGFALLLLLLQWGISILIGTAMGGKCPPPGELKAASPSIAASPVSALISALKNGGRAILTVCACVVFFGVFCAFLPKNALLRGLVELTGGLLLLDADLLGRATAAFLIGWGGLSVAAQVAASAEAGDIPVRRWVPLRLLHGAGMALSVFLGQFSPLFALLPLMTSFAVFSLKRYGKKRRNAL